MPAFTLERLDAIMERFVVTEYNARPHSESGQASAERWGASGFILPLGPFVLADCGVADGPEAGDR